MANIFSKVIQSGIFNIIIQHGPQSNYGLSNKYCWDNWMSYAKKMNLSHYLVP